MMIEDLGNYKMRVKTRIENEVITAEVDLPKEASLTIDFILGKLIKELEQEIQTEDYDMEAYLINEELNSIWVFYYKDEDDELKE